eukprot:9037543-Pyramimonas_sp.AAC.1
MLSCSTANAAQSTVARDGPAHEVEDVQAWALRKGERLDSTPKLLLNSTIVRRDLQARMGLERRGAMLGDCRVAGNALRSDHEIDEGSPSLRTGELRARRRQRSPRS